MSLLKWLTLGRKSAPESPYPLGVTEADIQALSALRATSHWPRYLAVLTRLGEQQASELTSGLPHDKYLFTAGAFTALRRVFTLTDDLIAAATKIEELSNARDRTNAARVVRNATSFVNTPWYAGWRSDAADR